MGLALTEVNVAGGKILFIDRNGDNKATGQIYNFGEIAPWKVTSDYVLMETTTANMAQFNVAITAMGLNPVVDYFA